MAMTVSIQELVEPGALIRRAILGRSWMGKLHWHLTPRPDRLSWQDSGQLAAGNGQNVGGGSALSVSYSYGTLRRSISGTPWYPPFPMPGSEESELDEVTVTPRKTGRGHPRLQKPPLPECPPPPVTGLVVQCRPRVTCWARRHIRRSPLIPGYRLK
jgi:hypothetical protein